MKILLLAILALAANAQSAPGLPQSEIDSLVEKTRRDFKAPGIAIGIIRGDQVVYLKGYGVKRLGGSDPVTPDTRFAMASTSKAVTTAAMALLVDEGKMQWDDPVRKHLPGFHLADPSANELVTMRDIVSHRTGLSRNDALWYSTTWNRQQVLQHIGEVPLSKPFRSTYQYQNIMFLAAGEAVGRIIGGTWEQFVAARIFAPLGMTNSGFSAKDTQQAPDVATPHVSRKGVVKEVPWKDISNIGPAGSLNSSVRDWTRWLRFQMADGTFEGKRLISEKNLRETQSPQMVIRDEAPWAELNPETTMSVYGLGWRIQDYRGRQLISHGGSIDGFRAQVGFLPKEQLGFVILTNAGVSSLVEALRYGILDILTDAPRRDWNTLYLSVLARQDQDAEKKKRERISKRVPTTKPSLALSEYAGAYDNAGYGTARVNATADGLQLEWGALKLTLNHWHYDTFQSPDDESDQANTPVVFRLNGDGHVESLSFLDQDFRHRPEKVAP